MVNIAMISRDRPKLTTQSIRNLYANTDSEDFCFVVVDDGSQIESVENLIALSEEFGFDIRRHNPGIGVGASKNSAIDFSDKIYGRQSFLYLSDNDVYFTPGWLDTLSGLLRCQPAWKIIGGWNHPYHQPTERMKIAPSRIGEPWRELWTQGAVAGVSWMLSWDTWDKFGPFDANAQGVRQSEDTAFCQRVTAAGFRVGCVWPHVVYHTGVTDTFGQAPPGAELFHRNAGVLYQ